MTFLKNCILLATTLGACCCASRGKAQEYGWVRYEDNYLTPRTEFDKFRSYVGQKLSDHMTKTEVLRALGDVWDRLEFLENIHQKHKMKKNNRNNTGW